MEKQTIYSRTYYNESDFEFEQGLMMEYLHKVTNDFILLYKIDKVSSASDNIYGESKPNEKKFLPKKELLAKVNVMQEDPKYQADGFGYSEMLNTEFSVPELLLQRNGIGIDLGDIVRWRDRFFEVTKVMNIAEASKMSKNYKNKMRKFYGIMAKEDSVPKELLLDNEIN